ncbi:MAG: excinuclease ABC subunit UvrC [Saprospiraceae bacterium]|nr:excinuclease ABC subunit UvrC [Saprospiraceae bacterium]HQV67743.1 excinuclease ABC subunit UvrC [Saprospiraceae bacterium]HQV97005.1 excinuclease ABC subunit UvrC [Saprospiraceae bacterium]
MKTEDFKAISETIPHEPGVYRFLDEEGTILYVGKAKSLKNRLSSYFGDKKHTQYKTVLLTRNAHHIEFTVVETEHDALLLENSLIKKFQPRYNVMLKDGKSYTYICIKNELFPRVFFTRKMIRDGSVYFGPYTSKYRVNILLEIIRKLFQLRTCSYQFTTEGIARGKFKVCLEYHIKNCLGPCEGFETEQNYMAKIDQVKNILKGNLGNVKKYITDTMKEHAENLEFEQAQMLKEKLIAFEDYQSSSTVVSTTIKDIDVFAIVTDETMAYVNYLKIVNGTLVNTDIAEMQMNLDDDPADLLSFVIPTIRERFESNAPEVVVPILITLPDPKIVITVPQIGDKKKLLELAETNIDYFIRQKKRDEISHQKKVSSSERILTTLKNDLQMDVMPLHIECFDNSNLQGTNPVSSCVVFKNAKPSNKDYRHFNVKTVVGPDDFASMQEVVFRRYKRLLAESKPLPQLIIIDGGKGQLSSAVSSLEQLGILDKVTVIGIAKKLEEIFFPGDSIPLYINKKSESLKLIQHARNEAHRFAISFHRDQRSKNFLGTQLTNIPGIGKVTAEKLLKKFGSIQRVKDADPAEVEALIGKANTKKVLEFITE